MRDSRPLEHVSAVPLVGSLSGALGKLLETGRELTGARELSLLEAGHEVVASQGEETLLWSDLGKTTYEASCGENSVRLLGTKDSGEWSEQDKGVVDALCEVVEVLYSHGAHHVDLTRKNRLDELVADVAVRLMNTDATSHQKSLEWVLEKLAMFLGADVAFLRRNDHDRGVTVMEAEWPNRNWSGPGPDPLGVVAFNSDVMWANMKDQREPYLMGAEQTTEDYLELVKSGAGVPEVGGGTVPLLLGETTWGVLGFLHFTSHIWSAAEIHTLQAVASMIAHLQGRLLAEAKIVYNASHDDLTGLANRRALLDEIDGRISRQECLSLLVFDLDRFKVINDYLGHASGDELLRALANRLSDDIRAGDFAARLGGDEFVVVVPSTDPEVVEATAGRLVELIASPVEIAGQLLSHTASVGVASFNGSDDYASALSLLANADVALYAAKAGGRNQVVRYDGALSDLVDKRARQEIELAEALSEGQLRLYYQPEIDLGSGDLLAVEALVRWEHPSKGLLAAGEFISVAEETGLVAKIGRWVINEACEQLNKWDEEYPGNGIKMRVNMSPRDFRAPDLLAYIITTLAKHQVAPHRLCIEITEHALNDDNLGLSIVLEELRRLGLEVAIDDFGTGFASMSELKDIPSDALKLDMSFVMGITTSKYDRAIVAAICTLAGALDLEVIGEGVENYETARELVELGCHRAQGYLFSRALPGKDLGALIKSGGLSPKDYSMREHVNTSY